MNTLNVTIPGLTIAYRTWGNPNNPPIVALHGWLDNANSFAPLAEFLDKDFYFIAVDLPGHGHSSHLPPGCNYHFYDSIFTVVNILNALKLQRVHLMGHSMGACLASLLAGVTPERFDSVFLIEGLGPFSYPEDTACKQLAEYALYLRHSKSRTPRAGHPNRESAALARAAKGYVSLDIATLLTERGIREEDGLYYWRHDPRLVIPSPLRMTEEQICSCLREITAKTCLLWATGGFSFDSELMQHRIKQVPNLITRQLKGGHHVHMEQVELTGKLIKDFYEEL